MEEGERPAGTAANADGARLPYEKPRVAWEQPLEAQPSLMSGCQKSPAGEADCLAIGPPSS